jgi:HK97 family phage major capsid protein
VNINSLKHQRAKLRDEATAINNLAEAEKRELTLVEAARYNQIAKEVSTISSKLDRHAAGATFATPSMFPIQVADEDEDDTPGPFFFGPGNRSERGDMKGPRFPEVAKFINNGEGGVMASLAEGGSLQYTVPGWEVQQFVAAYPTNAPFTEAGATEFNTPDAHQINVPIIVAGDAPAVFAEGSGPSSEQDANVYVAKLNADKRAFLTKITEEAAQDIDTLQNTLIAEGIRRVYRAVSDAVTDAMVTSLTAANALVSVTGDYYETLVELTTAAIDPTWQNQDNVLMMDTSSLAKFRNVRDLQDRPIFDPTARTLMGYRLVLNQRLRGKVVFGAFRPGVYIRQTPIIVQRLLELYSESGKIGIRFQRRSDQAFFSDAATASQAPQPLFMLNTDVGS